MKKQITDMVNMGLISSQELLNYFRAGVISYMSYIVLAAIADKADYGVKVGGVKVSKKVMVS